MWRSWIICVFNGADGDFNKELIRLLLQSDLQWSRPQRGSRRQSEGEWSWESTRRSSPTCTLPTPGHPLWARPAGVDREPEPQREEPRSPAPHHPAPQVELTHFILYITLKWLQWTALIVSLECSVMMGDLGSWHMYHHVTCSPQKQEITSCHAAKTAAWETRHGLQTSQITTSWNKCDQWKPSSTLHSLYRSIKLYLIELNWAEFNSTEVTYV